MWVESPLTVLCVTNDSANKRRIPFKKGDTVFYYLLCNEIQENID